MSNNIGFDLHLMQKKAYEMLLIFDDFCIKNNINYCLVGGTLLGAVRHQGFIPWDDDIDIGMPRKDYEKFISLCSGLDDRYEAVCFDIDNNYIYSFLKVYDKSTTVEEDIVNPYVKGVWLDVFPLDGTFHNPFFQSLHYSIIRLVKALIATKNGAYHRSDFSNLRRILKLISGVFGNKILHKTLNFFLTLKGFDESYYVGNFVGRWGKREIMPKNIFSNFKKMHFVSNKFPCPVGYDSYLTRMYGDYMKLPPIEKRRVDHNLRFVELERSYEKK